MAGTVTGRRGNTGAPVLVTRNTSRAAEAALTAEEGEEAEERSSRRNQSGEVSQNNPAQQSRSAGCFLPKASAICNKTNSAVT